MRDEEKINRNSNAVLNCFKKRPFGTDKRCWDVAQTSLWTVFCSILLQSELCSWSYCLLLWPPHINRLRRQSVDEFKLQLQADQLLLGMYYCLIWLQLLAKSLD